MNRHVPVMAAEVAARLVNIPPGLYIDGTVGSGGHSEYLLKNFPDINIVGLDRDETAVERTAELLKIYGRRFRVFASNFRDVPEVLKKLGTERIAGILLDLGISSEQVDAADRGFSYRQDGPLDMRYDRHQALTAEKIINEYPLEKLTEIFREFGEEKFAGLLAGKIVFRRKISPIVTTGQLALIVENTVPRYARKFHPARRIFQALRIAVNDELDNLRNFLKFLPEILMPGGRAVIISYHSGEDRLVKESFRWGKEKNVYRLRRPFLVRPGAAEMVDNPRSRSARLRAAERL